MCGACRGVVSASTFDMCRSVLWQVLCSLVFFFQAEDGIRDLVRSRGLGDVYKRQLLGSKEQGRASDGNDKYCEDCFCSGVHSGVWP